MHEVQTIEATSNLRGNIYPVIVTISIYSNQTTSYNLNYSDSSGAIRYGAFKFFMI